MAKRSALIALLLLLAQLIPSPASAVTIQDIITLSKAGVSDTVLLALVDRDKSVFAIEADELVMLKGAGVSEAVVIAMLKSGREPEPPAAPPLADVLPTLVIVGHGPDRPNTFHQFDGFGSPMLPLIPYVVVGSGLVHGANCVGVSASSTKPSATGPQLGRLTNSVGRIVNSPVILSGGDGTAASATVVDCPQAAPTRPRSRR
jgi:hypothetical protein